MYRVTWGREVIDRIAKVYDGLDDDHREQLLAALESLDAKLLSDPLNAGESRNTPLNRIAIEGPLAVAFRVDEAQQVVHISGVSYSHRKS